MLKVLFSKVFIYFIPLVRSPPVFLCVKTKTKEKGREIRRLFIEKLNRKHAQITKIMCFGSWKCSNKTTTSSIF